MNPRRWRTLHLALVLLVAVAAWTPGSAAPASGLGDKLDHLLAFAALAASAALAWPGAAFRIAVALVAYGGLIEVVQMLVPGRHASLLDLGADAIGVALGLAAAAMASRAPDAALSRRAPDCALAGMPGAARPPSFRRFAIAAEVAHSVSHLPPTLVSPRPPLPRRRP